MLKLFKRLAGIEEKKPARPVRRVLRKSAYRDVSGPAPLPAVVEGNEQSDWQLWHDSVNSQLQGLGPSSRNYEETQPSQLDELDPFQRVKSKDS